MKDKDQQLIYEAYARLEEARGGRWDSQSGHVVEDMLYAVEMIQTMSLEDWYKRVAMGGHFRDLLDFSSLVNLYAGNKQRSRGQLGPSGAPNRTVGPWQATQDFVNKLVRYLNPLGLDPSKGRDRVYETPEFALKHNKAEYDEYDRMYRDAWKKMIHSRRDEDIAGMTEWESKRDEYAQLRSKTDFAVASKRARDIEDQLVERLQTAPITMDSWKKLPPEAQQELTAAYEAIKIAMTGQN